jgi:hypothetical protein
MDDDYKFLRNVRSPITDDMLRPLDPECRVVQFDAPLTAEDLIRLSEFLRGYPNVPLRVYGWYSGTTDLSFLRYFPFLRGFQADVYLLNDLDGLGYLPEDLEFLALGQTKRRLSLKPLARFENLRDLFLEGHTKDFNVVSGLHELVYLTLRSITLPDLSPLLPLHRLRSLGLKLGGTKNLGLLPKLSGLRHLELWMVKGMVDISPIGELMQLRFLFLQSLKNVTVLPTFAHLNELVRCHVDDMKGLTDVCPIAAARNLEELLVTSMRKIPAAGFECFKGHPNLREALIGLCSIRRNAEVDKLLSLPAARYFEPIKQYVENLDERVA